MANDDYIKTLSDQERRIYDAYDLYQQLDNKSMLVFWESWGDQLHAVGVPRGKYPWTEHDQFMFHYPNAQLIVALDLDKPFEEQWPDHYRGTLQSFQAFAVRPLIWIPDRAGKIPAKMQQDFIKAALKPEVRLAYNNPNADKLPKRDKIPLSKRHLKPV